MDPLTTAAASGLRARMESLDILANNLANTTTAGFKADREYFNVYVSPDGAEVPSIDSHWTDLSQGSIETTGNPLDVALSGPGFFAVQTPQGVRYTRNGAFHLNSLGELVTPDNYKVLNDQSQSIQLDLNQAVKIDKDGVLWQGANQAGKLLIAGSPNAPSLAKAGSTYFQWSPSNSTGRPAATEIVQGGREASNAGSVDSAVRMVGVMRQFEALQRAVQLGGEMNRRAVEEVARVNP
ncbi:MAG: flagellar hook basal-body protein [Bryobacterales bacterium]|nr:flagellar hook basal-body protein [Bryobacterales bacterium]